MINYLLEIGVEELPARDILPAIRQLKDKFSKMLEEYGLNYKELKSYSTPRRLSILVCDLDEFQKAKTELVKGPSKKIAFDKEENPSKALLGFMKSKGLEEADLEIQGDYVYGKIKSEEKHIREIFANEIPKIIKSINFPKNMRWGGKSLRFARPIRWIVSVSDSEVIDLDLEGIKASNISRGHRFLGSSEIVIDNPLDYEEILEKNYVIVDREKRREKIKFTSERLAREVGGEINPEEDLIEELSDINEFPTAILGKIKNEYLELPAIVVTTPMKDHLRFIPVYKNKDTLLPYFISIRNGTEENKEVVIKGNEKVLGARLEDARFFYNEDLEKSLEELAERLDEIIYHEKLGTVKLRVERLKEIVDKLGDHLDLAKESKNQLKRATELSKADLLTKMVTEFSELQGIMGGIYALKEGEDELVSKAISEQYLPKSAGGELPETTIGSILSIADKIDSIAGLFAIGLVPTGSQDPFGLRRAAIGIINILNETGWNLSLQDLIKDGLYSYLNKNNLVFDNEKVEQDIYSFIISRIKVILLDENIRYDIVDAILNTKPYNVSKIFEKAKETDDWFKQSDRSELVEVFKRINNIAVKAESTDFSEEYFNDYEKNLYNKFKDISENINENQRELDYGQILDELGGLKQPVNEYLDEVLIFTDDEDLKNNRLGLLKTINDYVKEIFDFSVIVN